jgi:hypothetical protein
MGTTNNHLSIINNHFAFAPLHLSRTLYKSALFMQNKANFQDVQMNVNSILTKDYENNSNWTLGENKPKQTQFQRQKNAQARLFRTILSNLKKNL